MGIEKGGNGQGQNPDVPQVPDRQPPQDPKKKRDTSSGFITAGTLLLFGGGVELAASQLGFHVDTRAGVIFAGSLLGGGAALTATGIIFRATKR